MAPAALKISELLDTLEPEDYNIAVSFIMFLSDKRKRECVNQAEAVIDSIQSIIGDDKGWDSEEEMIADMAKFRRERMGL